MSTWGIVGGGMLGSTLALRLADAGQDVTVFERAHELGGLAAAWKVGGVVWDRHYHVTLASDRHTRSLLSTLGLEKEMRWVKTRTGTWSGGELHSMSNVTDYLTYPALSLWDKARLGRTILSAARTSDWKKLEQIPVETWLRTMSGDRVFERFWLPLLKAKLGDAYAETSAAFIWATIQRLYAARSSGTKTEQFGYVPGGYQRILSSLSEALAARGVEVRLGQKVEAVTPGPTVQTSLADHRFEHVVVTAAPPIARHIVTGLTEHEVTRLGSIRYQGIVCASVLARRPLEGFYLTYLYEEAPFTAVVEMSALVDRAEFAGNTLLYLPKYCSPDDRMFEEPDATLRARFLSALERIYPGFRQSDVLAFRVSKVRNVFPISTLGYSESIPGFDTSISGLHLVSSAQIVNGTLNVNDTVSLAEQALLHFLSHERATVP